MCRGETEECGGQRRRLCAVRSHSLHHLAKPSSDQPRAEAQVGARGQESDSGSGAVFQNRTGPRRPRLHGTSDNAVTEIGNYLQGRVKPTRRSLDPSPPVFCIWLSHLAISSIVGVNNDAAPAVPAPENPDARAITLHWLDKSARSTSSGSSKKCASPTSSRPQIMEAPPELKKRASALEVPCHHRRWARYRGVRADHRVRERAFSLSSRASGKTAGCEGKLDGETEEYMRYRRFMHYAVGSSRIATKISSAHLEPNFPTHFAFLEAQLESVPSGGPCLCGTTLTGADILMSFPPMAAQGHTPLSKEKCPKLWAYIEMLKEGEGYKHAGINPLAKKGSYIRNHGCGAVRYNPQSPGLCTRVQARSPGFKLQALSVGLSLGLTFPAFVDYDCALIDIPSDNLQGVMLFSSDSVFAFFSSPAGAAGLQSAVLNYSGANVLNVQ
ncbi:hypothetical protein B0H10DRAFT_1938364 [Mycena sp. CBHHK59/15]|nr:hypothetical protein B0H10DRAFT_1938364 [Mycena sp. CBHHK59/15]